MRPVWLALALAVLLALIVSVWPWPAAQPPAATGSGPRGVVLIVADSLRADHLGAYGYPRETSPRLDRLAGRSALFARAYSQSPWTTPAVASLFTSLYPSVHRAGHARAGFGYTWRLSEDRPTLASVLRAHGFRTAALLNNPSISGRRGFDRGFDVFRNDEARVPDRPSEPTHADAVALLEQLRDRPFLLVWHLIDPHWPYYPPDAYRLFVDPDYRGRFAEGFTADYVGALVNGVLELDEAEMRQLIALYDGEVRYVDHQIGQLLDAIDARGLRERVSVVVTSDHGESFLEHGHFGHVLPLYEETLRVPLLVYDARFEPRRISRVVESIDVMPTLLELAGVPAPGGLQGRSLVPLLAGRDADWDDAPAFSEAAQFVERKTLRSERFRLIWGVAGQLLDDAFAGGGSKFVDGEHKLYTQTDERAVRLDDAHPEAGALLRSAWERVRRNETAQVARSSLFRSFFFFDDWREQAYEVRGRVSHADRALHIEDDPGAHALWRVELPRPVQDLELNVRAACSRPVRYFAVSPDRVGAVSVPWQPKGNPGFETTQLRVSELAGSRTLYLKFFQSRPARCSLKGFTVQAFFEEEPREELDELTRERLRALGYAE